MKKELIAVLRKLREIEKQQSAYIDLIPDDISGIIYDNQYSNLQGLKSDIVIQALFVDAVEDVYWFLYEFTPGRTPGPHIIDANKKEYIFNSDEDYFTYLETV
jgi:hypothetical protein